MSKFNNDTFRGDSARNQRIAKQVREYWKRKGRDLQTQIVREQDPVTGDRMVWGVRSNAVNGLPPRNGRASA
jgi:hypothetical protein